MEFISKLLGQKLTLRERYYIFLKDKRAFITKKLLKFHGLTNRARKISSEQRQMIQPSGTLMFAR